MRVKVLRIGGESYDVDVSDQATCEDLKSQLVEVASLAAERQRIIFRGRVLTNEMQLSEAGITDGMTLHLVDSPPAGEPQGAVPPAQQQSQAGGPGGATGGMGFMGGVIGGMQGMPPGSQGATMMGHMVLDPASLGGGSGADLGSMIAQQIAAALGGVGMQASTATVGGMPGMMPAGIGPQQGPAGPAPHQPSVPLRMPTLPSPAPPEGPLPHFFTGMALMMSRLEHESYQVELDPLPHIRESYSRPAVHEVRHFLQAARTLLNTAPLATRTRNAINEVLELEDLPPLRPYRRPRGPPSGYTDSSSSGEDGDGSTDSSSGHGGASHHSNVQDHGPSQQQSQGGGQGAGSLGAGQTSSAGRGAQPAAARAAAGGSATGSVRSSRSSDALRSFPIPAEGSDDEEGRRGGLGGAGGQRGGAATQPEEEMPSLVSDDEEEEQVGGGREGPRQQEQDSPGGGEGNELGEESVEEDSAWETEDEEEDDLDAHEPSVSDEQLLLVAAVCLGEMASRLLYCLGDDGGRLWELSDRLRTLSHVQRRDFPRLAGMVQELTARTYRLGGMWSELSRGVQYLGAALESGNMALVTAIPGYLCVRGSQALPNVQRPFFPPVMYVPQPTGYFAGQIPDSSGFGIAGVGIPVSSTVVDLQFSGTTAPPPVGSLGAPGAHPPPQQQQQQQQQSAQAAQQAAQRGPASSQPAVGVVGAPAGSAPVVVEGGEAQQQQQRQQGAQSGAARQAPARPFNVRQALSSVHGLVSSSRAGMGQAADRVQEARNAMQAAVTGREGGPQLFLQRAHHTMQALVTAEESIRRARQRAEQAEQQLQRILRSQPVVQQAVRITMGGPQASTAGQAGAPGQAGAAGRQQQGIPLGAMLQGVMQGVLRQHAQHVQQRRAASSRASQSAGVPDAAGTAGGGAPGSEAGPGAEQGPAGFGTGSGSAPGGAAEESAPPASDQPIPAMGMAQELVSALGLSGEEQQEMLQEFMGMTQALQQSSLAALNLPALLADIRAALAAALRDLSQQAQRQTPDPGSVQSGIEQDGAPEAPAVGEAAVPRLVDAVRAVLEQHLARLAQAPALQEFLPHLQHMGINLGPSTGQPTPPASGAHPAAAPGPAGQASAPPASQGEGGEQPGAATKVQTGAGAAVAGAAAAAAAAAEGGGGGGVDAAPASLAAQPCPGPTSGAPGVGSGEAPAPAAGSESGGSDSSKGGNAPLPSKPAGLGLGKGLVRGVSKGKGKGPSLPVRAAGKQGGAGSRVAEAQAGDGGTLGSASLSSTAMGGSLLQLIQGSQARERSACSVPPSTSGAAAGSDAAPQRKQQQGDEEEGGEVGEGAAGAPPASTPCTAEQGRGAEAGERHEQSGVEGSCRAEAAHPSATPPASTGGGASGAGPSSLALQTTPPPPQAAGSNLASLMSGLLGGPSSRGGSGGGAVGGGGGGLMGLMGSVMQSPAFQQMASSPSMQRMAEQMLGGGGEGGGMDLGSLMGSLMGEMMGGAEGSSAGGPRARGAEGVLGGGGDEDLEDDGPVDIDAALLSVMPPEEAARWREIIQQDMEQMAQMEGQPSGAEGGFSDAYNALRMSMQRGRSRSGLFGLLSEPEGSQQGQGGAQQ